MSWIFLASLAALALALATTASVLRRTRDLRVALLGGVFVAFGVGQGVLARRSWGEPLGWDANLVIACAGLAASLLGWLAIRALGRTLGELDRTEALHWNSMEGVRALAELSGERALAPERRVERLLEIGSRCFGLEVAILSRVKGERYEVTAIRAPAGFPIGVGAALPLAETCCRHSCESARPVGLLRTGGRKGTGIDPRGAVPFEAYLGVALRDAGQVVGTLAFGTLEPRGEPFTASDKDLVELMARWLEMEREERRSTDAARAVGSEAEPTDVARAATTEIGPEAPALQAPWAGVRPARPRSVDLNALVGRMEEKLRGGLGPGVGLHLDLESGLAPTRDLRLPLEAIVHSLVRHASASLRGGGEIFVETRNLEPERAAPEMVPAHAPDRYVTLSVHDTSAEADADSLAALFDEDPSEGDAESAPARVPIRLSAVYRMLQRCGGDLSAQVEPGQGASFTIFLPRAEETTPSRPAADPAAVVAAARA